MTTQATRAVALSAALEKIARIAGEEIMDVHAQANFEAAMKTDGSPVTEADRRADAVIVNGLERLKYGIPIVTEERSESHAGEAADTFWLVDPLDGTREFLKRDGKGAFTANIALIEQQEPVLGVVFAPALDRMFAGIKGHGAREVQGRTVRPISCRSVPAERRVAVASASHRDTKTDAWLAAGAIERTVSIGSSLKFCLVACGEADVYPRFGPTMEWDTAAGDAVLRAAGGTVQTPEGNRFTYAKEDFRNGPFIAWGARS